MGKRAHLFYSSPLLFKSNPIDEWVSSMATTMECRQLVDVKSNQKQYLEGNDLIPVANPP